MDEFLQLKRSFELFHGVQFPWFVRCDDESMKRLATMDGVHPVSFVNQINRRPTDGTREFIGLTTEKMKTMEDAWQGGVEYVMYLDADIIITSALLDAVLPLDAEVMLSPNYYPQKHDNLRSEHGIYNAGFILSRARNFHQWWAEAMAANPTPWSDQLCLNYAHEYFKIAETSEKANIGFWRSENCSEYEPIPSDVLFLHVHLHQPLSNIREWLNRTFALHCLRFLRSSEVLEHRLLFEDILANDRAHWYRASLLL